MKILIISYHFPPMNVIASRRAEAYAKYFKAFGYAPTIVTHTANELDHSVFTLLKGIFTISNKKRDAVQYKSLNTHEEIRIPHKNTWIQAFIFFINKIPILRTFFKLLLIKLGHAAPTMVYSYQNFRSYLFKHLKEHHYDYVLSVYSPDYHIRLGYDVNKRFGIPFIADYRDLWDNRLMDSNYRFLLIERIILNAIIKNHQKWLTNALFYTNVSEPWVKKMNALLHDNRGFVLTNGYDKEQFENDHTEISKDYFYITYTGRVYPQNDFSIFFQAISLFLAAIDKSCINKVKIRFFTRRNIDLSKIKASIPASNLETYTWISKEEVITRLKESAILFLPGWVNIAGWYPGKAFEYLGTKRNMLITPDDGGVLHEMIEKTKAGMCSSDPEEVSNFLANKFKEWVEKARPSYQGLDEEIEKFTREKLVERLASKINTFNNSNSI